MNLPSRRAIVATCLCTAFARPNAVLGSDTPPSARGIEEKFIAPCCWRENLAVHRSPEAEAMRAEIEKFCSEGKSESEIVEHYVKQYGERILRVPRGQRSWWLFAMPAGMLAAGAAFLAYFLKINRKPAAVYEGPLPPIDDDQLQG